MLIRVKKDREREESAVAEYSPTNPKTIWPAVMLAARRKHRVRGRIKILRVSIRMRAGLSQSGAPEGSRFATTFFG